MDPWTIFCLAVLLIVIWCFRGLIVLAVIAIGAAILVMAGAFGTGITLGIIWIKNKLFG